MSDGDEILNPEESFTLDFIINNNSFYLEIHHVKRLADDGSDRITNAIALCPNCHREFHHGINAGKLKTNI